MAQELGFSAWMAAVRAEAINALGHEDTEWLIGGEADMREGFENNMNPEEYVAEQISNIE